jgi:endoglucanase
VIGIHGPLAALLVLTMTGTPLTPRTHSETLVVEVEGRRLVDERGRAMQLRGVNRSGTEYACVQGLGLFDGPVDGESVAAIASWSVNAVRIPLNEDCWLGSPVLDESSSGTAYQRAVTEYADRLASAGMLVILDLHWTGRSNAVAIDQQPMAGDDRSVRFWSSVATVFRDRPWVVFDAFNEPHDISWECWRDGCDGYAGMQDLVDAIRSVGATQPIVLSGLEWGEDLRRWLEYRPDDPEEALVAGVHLYDFKRCVTTSCWDEEIGPVAAEVPVVVTEFGDTDCGGDFSATLMSWADRSGVSYLAWAWNPWDCGGGPALINSFDGTPTSYGTVIRNRLQARIPPVDRPILVPQGAFPM